MRLRRGTALHSRRASTGGEVSAPSVGPSLLRTAPLGTAPQHAGRAAVPIWSPSPGSRGRLRRQARACSRRVDFELLHSIFLDGYALELIYRTPWAHKATMDDSAVACFMREQRQPPSLGNFRPSFLCQQALNFYSRPAATRPEGGCASLRA